MPKELLPSVGQHEAKFAPMICASTPWRSILLTSSHASSAQLRQLVALEHRNVRFYASANTSRIYRDIASILDSPQNEDPSPRAVEIVAHVRSVRAQKRRAFLALGDGSTARSLQALLDPTEVSGLSTGTAVRISGSWIPSPAQGQTHELHTEKLEVLGAVDSETFPIQKKHLTPEFLRTIPHLRLRTASNALQARLRSDAEHHISSYFRNDGFIRLHPPAITSSDCEGAGEVFTISPKDKQVPAATAGSTEQVTPSGGTSSQQEEEFFRSPKYLTVSNQLHLEAFVHEHQRVWSLAPTFRAERSDTPRHLSEFYMLEAELRCSSLSEVMDVVEKLVRNVAKHVQESALGTELLTGLSHSSNDAENISRLQSLASRYRGLRRSYWPRITYAQAISILKEAVKEKPDLFKFQPSWDDGLHLEHEKYIASTIGNGSPVFVTDYPARQKPFYMLPTFVPKGSDEAASSLAKQDDRQRWKSHALPPKPSLEEHLQQAHPTVACFDLLLPDVGELVGGSLREHRLDVLEAVMKHEGLTNIDWYLDLRKYGSVPHGGFGLGFDRLLMYLSGADSVRDVVQWPRYYGRCDA